MLTYVVRLLPERQLLEITVELAASSPSVRLATPSWVPGAYAFLKYARDVIDVCATDVESGRVLPVVRDGWEGFRVEGATKRVLVSYLAHAADPAWGEVAGILTGEAGVLLGTRYLRPEGYDGPCRVTYALPEGWAIHHPSGARRVSEHVYEYARYQDLVDTPVVFGAFTRRTRDVHGTPFHFVFLDDALGFAEHGDALIDTFVRTAEGCFAIFGSFPFEDYTFVLTHDPRFHWGLEHATSTMIGLGPNVYLDEDAHLDAVRVAVHELMHAWNVKRLRPKALMSLDLDAGTFVDGLWVAEGFTRYYEFVLAARAGALSSARFFSNVANYYVHLVALPAYARVAPTDSSYATFLNHGRYPGVAVSAIDYYDAGMLIAFDLDVAARAKGTSLDVLFRDFYEAYVSRGFDTADVEAFFGARLPELGAMVEAEATRAAGLSTPERLKDLGFELRFEQRKELGLVLKEREITSVVDDGPAALAGLAVGDELVNVQGFPFSRRALSWARDRGEVRLDVLRGQRTLSFRVTPRPRRVLTGLAFQGTPAQEEAILAWLGTAAPKLGEANALRHYDNFHGTTEIV